MTIQIRVQNLDVPGAEREIAVYEEPIGQPVKPGSAPNYTLGPGESIVLHVHADQRVVVYEPIVQPEGGSEPEPQPDAAA